MCICMCSEWCAYVVHLQIYYLGWAHNVRCIHAGLSFHGVVVVSVLHDGGWLCCGFCASYVCGV